MKRKLWLMALICAVLYSGTAALADGDFYVIAGGGGAVGTKITSLPYTINNSGFYFLSSDLTTTGNGITVAVNNVTIDLMGFSLIGPGGGGEGISVINRTNVEIRNGTVRNFYYSILGNNVSANIRISNVRVLSNAFGIQLPGKGNLVNGCSCSNNGGVGILVGSGTIINCVSNNNSTGIILSGPGSVIGNIANDNVPNNFSLGTENTKTPIMVDRNSASGLSTNYHIPSGSQGIVGLSPGTTTNAGAP